MSPVSLLLVILAVLGVGGLSVLSVKLYRAGKLDDEAAERKRLAEEAAHAEELEKAYPGTTAKLNKDKIKKFSSRT